MDESLLASKRIKLYDAIVDPPNDKNETRVELTSKTLLQDMNEDCLLRIFKALDLMDLCSIAETCKRFEEIAGYVIPKKLSLIKCRAANYEIKLGNYRKCWDSTEILPQGFRDIKRIFKSFGSLLTKVSIYSSETSRNGHITECFVLNLVTIHCVGNLKDLRIECTKEDIMKIPRALAAELNPIFKELKHLYLKYVRIDEGAAVFADCNSLFQLQLLFVDGCDAILENVYPILRYLKFASEDVVPTLSKFILRHSTLETLDLWVSYDDKCKLTIPNAIAAGCKKLYDLKIGSKSSSHTYLQPLKKIKSLKRLSVVMMKLSLKDLQIFAAMTELRRLSLWQSSLPKDSRQFPSMTQLTYLKVSGYDGNGVIDIVSRLTHLKRLMIYRNSSKKSKFVLDEETFKKIADIVRGRQNVLALSCKFNLIPKNCDQNEMVKLVDLSPKYH